MPHTARRRSARWCARCHSCASTARRSSATSSVSRALPRQAPWLRGAAAARQPASPTRARGALHTLVAAQQRSRRAAGALVRSCTGGVIKACACLLSISRRDCDLRVARVQAHLQTLREPLFHHLRSVSQRAPLSCSSSGALYLRVRDACATRPLTPLPSQPLFLLTLQSRRRHHCNIRMASSGQDR